MPASLNIVHLKKYNQKKRKEKDIGWDLNSVFLWTPVSIDQCSTKKEIYILFIVQNIEIILFY
jgi:hypothetical protein